MTTPRTNVMHVLLAHDQRHLLYYVVLLEIATSLRRDLPDFTLSHFVFIADELDIDLIDVQIRPYELDPTSEGLGVVAAGVWGEGAETRWLWKARLNAPDLPEPTLEDRETLLAAIRRLPFVRRAAWSRARDRT